MLQLDFYKNKNANSTGFGKVYTRVDNKSPYGLDELAQHMADHNSPYSKGVIKGVLTDMVVCIRELVLGGQPVQLPDLAIFKASITCNGASTAEEYDIAKYVKKVRLQVSATGVTRAKFLRPNTTLRLSKLAQRIASGELTLSGEKGKYLVEAANSGSNGGVPSGNDEP
jgi:hypothetical protein